MANSKKKNPKVYANKSTLLGGTSVFAAMVGARQSPEERLRSAIRQLVQAEVFGNQEEKSAQHRLQKCIQQAAEENDIGTALLCAVELGAWQERGRSRIVQDARRELNNAESERDQSAPIKARPHYNRLMKVLIQSYARRIWEQVDGSVFRLGQMTIEMVDWLPDFHDFVIDAVQISNPDAPKGYIAALKKQKPPVKQTIRSWLVAVAPPSARQPGRPKQK